MSFDTPLAQAIAHHPRKWGAMRYVYPVISRRAGGLSVGVNLNPDRACNFNCVYCSVDRSDPPDPCPFDLDQLIQELCTMLRRVRTGALWEDPAFADVPGPWRRLCDIAFSGDGEPTACPRFAEAVQRVAEVKASLASDDVSLVLITNATLLQRPPVCRGLAALHAAGGVVWAKLDAGSDAYYRCIDRSRVPLQRILDNLLHHGRQHPLVIQTMLVKLMGRPMPDAEFESYIDRVADLIEAGCRVGQVQLYTLARRPAEPWVEALDEAALQRMADRVRQRLPGLRVDIYP